MRDKSGQFSKIEQDAMKARAKELKAEARANKTRADGEKDIKNEIAKLTEPDKSMATKIHELVSKVAPGLMPKTWYGMPAYADKDGKVVCFFKAGSKYESRYATFGFNDPANLDEGNMWVTSFAIIKLTEAEEKIIAELVKKAIS